MQERNRSAIWQEVERLQSEDKYREALGKVEEILGLAREAGDDADWARALIRASLLQRALSGPETAVRELLSAEWPDVPLQRAWLHLFAAEALWDYYGSYSWMIDRREQSVSDEELAPDRWTQRQVMARIEEHYRLAWEGRQRLGEEPLEHWKEYVVSGAARPELRPTLRDFLTYRWVEFLGSSITWTPAEDAQRSWLSLEELLRPPEERPAAAPPLDAHPLVRAVWLLDDLYRWHREREHDDAALETQLRRFELLYRHWRQERDREEIVAALERLLPRFRHVPWYAAGMHRLARYRRDAGKLVEAMAAAREGFGRYPDSPGGQWCLRLQKEIEAPWFSLQSMTLDRTGTRSVLIESRNLGEVHFRAYALELETALRDHGNRGFRPSVRDVRRMIERRSPAAAWHLEIEDPGDYREHRTYTVPPLSEPGFYVIVASLRPDFAEEDNLVAAATLLISPWVLVVESHRDRVEAFVLEGDEGRPVSGVSVTAYERDYRTSPRELSTRTTDEAGKVVFERTGQWRSVFLVARRGELFTFDPTMTNLGGGREVREELRELIYTDRSVYRPGQKLYFKVVAYRGREARYETVPNQELTIRLRDPNRETVAELELRTNDFGTASGEFLIPAGRLLGSYQLQTDHGSVAIRVEEYRRPTFEVTLDTPEGEARLNAPVRLVGRAEYYFGASVSEGRVRYRVLRRTIRPWWLFWWRPEPDAQALEVAAGEVELDSSGEFRIEFQALGDPPSGDEEADAATRYAFEVRVEVTAAAGETRTARRTVTVGRCAVAARLVDPPPFLEAGRKTRIEVLREDLNGAPRPGRGRFELWRLQQPDSVQPASELPLPETDTKGARTPGDRLAPRWAEEPGLQQRMLTWKDAELVLSGELEHDEKGLAAVELPGLPAGAYRLRYRTEGARQTTYRFHQEILVAEAGAEIRAPLVLLSPRNKAAVGEQLELLVGSGYPGQTFWVEVLQDRRLLRRERFVSQGDLRGVQLAITAEHRGGLVVRAYQVHDYARQTAAVTIEVPWDDRRLKLSFETFRDRLRPGETETWTVAIRGPEAEIVAAEVLAYMFDRSLELFAPHRPPDIGRLYPLRYSASRLRCNLARGSALIVGNKLRRALPPMVSHGPDRLIVFDSYPIGGPGRGPMRFQAATMDDLPEAARPMMKMAMAPRGEEGMDRAAETPEEPALENAVVAGGEEPSEPEVSLREDFAETAFFLPHLRSDARGEVRISFTVPDSVTSWKVFLHALTRDLKFATLEKEAVTRKELMIRPYLPRFLREGDHAEIRIQIDNTGDTPLEGVARLRLRDPEDDQDRSADFGLQPLEQPWSAEPGSSTVLTWSITAPRGQAIYAVEAVAHAGELSDGERRVLPVLPARIQLSQSRFVTVQGGETRELAIEDLRDAERDPTLEHESLVLQVDGQLFFSMLRALPYLIAYPHECTEQTMNRFVSTGMLESLFRRHPALRAMASRFSARKEQFEPWHFDDPNQRMLLAETPWLIQARGGGRKPEELINILDPATVEAQRRAAIEDLRKAQLPDGGFPWWPGGPPSPYITMVILHGLARAAEFDVPVPRSMVRKAFRYLGELYRREYQERIVVEDYNYELITFLNYVLSCYPDARYYRPAFSEEDREAMLRFSLEHWRKHAPYSKALLAITAQRMSRAAEARQVLDSIMDSAITRRDQGTFWSPEERAWLWYNDTIEGHALILRALLEIAPGDSRADGIVLWLLLNRKMNQWRSTKATAEVLYSLARYLEARQGLASRERALLRWGERQEEIVFDPEDFRTGRHQVVIPGDEVNPETMWRAEIANESQGTLFASMSWHYSTEELPATARGDFLSVTRRYFRRLHRGDQMVLEPLSEGDVIAVGDQIEVQLRIATKHPMEFVHLRDPRAAGFEPEATTSGYLWQGGLGLYREVRDSGMNFFFEWLPQGEYDLSYRLRATTAGRFRAAPATLQSMYAPEFSAFSSGARIVIED
jgi:uncharacterized protein YfaS (alpha-2-macroglobulin family)